MPSLIADSPAPISADWRTPVSFKQPVLAPPLFNPSGDDRIESRQIWDGNPTGQIELNSVRYKWATKIYRTMRQNFWNPERIDLTGDRAQFSQLTSDEQSAYKGIISFLIFLDSVQVKNLAYIARCITAPEVSICLAEQTAQEALHAASYQYCVESIFNESDRHQIYNNWRTDKILGDRCQSISNLYQQYIDNPCPTTYLAALIGDYLLEGLYFYNGFNFFYVLASRQLMVDTSDMIRYINKDELTHRELFQRLVVAAMERYPGAIDKDQIYDMFRSAVTVELAWADRVIGNKILGMHPQATTAHTQYLANNLLRAIGLEDLYPRVSNPYAHLEKLDGSDTEVKGDFFETNNTDYQHDVMTGWGDF